MKQILFAIFILFLLSSFVFSQEENNKEKSTIEIKVCEVKLTEEGRKSSFQFSYRYIVNSNEDGQVKEIKQLHREHPKFVNEKDFIPCIKSWKLRPSEKIYVHIFYGTTSEQFFILISNKEEKIKILL